MTPSLKAAISKRQKAFCKYGKTSKAYKFWRNKVQHDVKTARSTYYSKSVEKLKEGNPSKWWREVRSLSGLTSSDTWFHQLLIDNPTATHLAESFNEFLVVDKSLKIIKLIKNAVRLILDNFGFVGFLVFGRMPVDSSHFSPHFDSILSPKYFILKVLKCSFNPNAWTSVNKAETPEVVWHPVLPQALVQKSIHIFSQSPKFLFSHKISLPPKRWKKSRKFRQMANVSYYSYRPYEKSSMVYGIG
jgi:hypothetical protein